MLQKLIEATIKSDKPFLPNKFTIAQGQLIYKARKDANMSQEDLAEVTYINQTSIWRIEKGTRAVSTEELLYLCHALNKPIGYFFPKEFRTEINNAELSEAEKEILYQIRQLDQSDLKKFIAQVKALVELSKK